MPVVLLTVSIRESYKMNRRDFLHVGSVGGITLPWLLQHESSGAQKYYATREGVAKSVIHVYLPGGMAAQESWDPKPYAPLEYRGPFRAIDTKIPGVQFSENMKQMARIADKVTVIRGMTHSEAAHERGTHNMFTGHRPSPAIQYPSFGAIVSHELGGRNNLPPYVAIPQLPNEHAGTGYLSSRYSAFSVGSNPESVNFNVKDLALPEGVSEDRFFRRRSMLNTIDQQFLQVEKSDELQAMSNFYTDAYAMISSPEARDAYALDKESNKTKDWYGRGAAGQRMLLARRLVEAGTRLVTLTYGGWDMHQNIERGFKSQGVELDKALAALITDLDQRGLLDSTLVVVSSEFGRTPKINATAGRDHWPRVFSTMLAGGGVKRGFVYGSSDSFSTEVEDDGLSPGDFASTIYNQLGITSDKELMAPGGRPMEIVDGGRVVDALLSRKA